MKRPFALSVATISAFCLLIPPEASAEKADRKEKIKINAVVAVMPITAKAFIDWKNRSSSRRAP